jgi:AbrB family looped-hinge helix DNA binding protein
MNKSKSRDTVYFSVKGQVVIPRRLREEFDIKEGTPAYVVATPDGILLKPVTAVTIRKLRGLLKRKSGDKPFDQWWAEYKAEEKALEEAKLGRHRS